MKRILLPALFALVLAGGASAAHAKQFRFVGMHPIPAAAGGGFCHIEVPHVHVFGPVKAKQQYRMHDGYYHFVGDPVAVGYDGPRHAYRGHHPLHVTVVGEPVVDYCYLEGPHYHYEEPLPAEPFTVEAGVYVYGGEIPVFEAEVVAAPAYVEPVYVEAPPPPRPAVFVSGPVVSAGIEVHVPVPSLRVEVGVPALVIGAPVHRHREVIFVDDHRHHGKGHWKGRGRGHWRH